MIGLKNIKKNLNIEDNKTLLLEKKKKKSFLRKKIVVKFGSSFFFLNNRHCRLGVHFATSFIILIENNYQVSI